MHAAVWGLALAFVLASVAARAGGKENLGCLAPKVGDSALRSYLLAESQRCFDRRHKEVAAIVTAEAARARQKAVRERWLAAIGPFPERCPLNPKVTGTLEREGYRIEKVIYESRPRHHVTANLYLPAKGKRPFPGVLLPCGHSHNGKASPAYQSACILLARHGFAVLCYDPIDQGERFQTLDARGKPLVGGTTAHTLVDVGARLVGGGTANFRIWDGIRSIDYLVSRPEVDAQRIGCTGNSGGGTMTCYLMATDERIFAAAPSCYVTSLERVLPTIGAQDGEQNITAQVALGIEHADYVTVRAPKPTLVLTATKDFFSIDGSWEAFREAKRLYGILGHGERVDLFEYPDNHGFSQPRRQAMLRWMRRWLQGIDDAPVEPAAKLSTDAELQCTPSGQVVHDLKGATTWDLNLQRAKALAPQRAAFWKDTPKAKCLAEVRRLAGIRLSTVVPPVQSVGTLRRAACVVEKLVIARKGEVPVPALLFAPTQKKGKLPAVIYVDGRGKARDAAPGGPVEKLAEAGHVVLSIDCRGFGETAPTKPRRYAGTEYRLTYAAVMLGRCLLGQRVEDVLAALRVVAGRPEVDAARIRVVGIERGGPVVLHAAALDRRIAAVTVERAIDSWMDVVATPLGKEQLMQIVPLALTRYDLPDLARAIAPRPVEIKSPVDPTGKPKKP